MAETINLTPQSANYSVYFIEPNNTLVQNTPFEMSAVPLIIGGADRINIGIVPRRGVGGVFKTPPFVPYMKITDVSILGADNAVLGHIDNGIICTPDGRMFFKPTFVSVLKSAMVDNQLDASEVEGVKIDFEVRPVYENPSGATPEFAVKQFIIILTLDVINIDDLIPIDNADTYPWLKYESITSETSASIGAVTGTPTG